MGNNGFKPIANIVIPGLKKEEVLYGATTGSGETVISFGVTNGLRLKDLPESLKRLKAAKGIPGTRANIFVNERETAVISSLSTAEGFKVYKRPCSPPSGKNPSFKKKFTF